MQPPKNGNPLFILPYTPGAVKISDQQARLLFTDKDLEKCERKGELKTKGHWQIPVSYTALCTSNTFNREVYPVEHGPLHVYGYRTLTNVEQSGYKLEGKVTISGKKYRGFTSSQLFELPNGKLINVATIHAVGAAEVD